MKNFALIALLLIITACSTTTTRQSPNFAKTWNKTYSVAILPPEVKIEYQQFDGDNQPMPEAEQQTLSHIKRNIPHDLREKGYNFADADFERLLESSPETKFELEKLRSSVGKSLSETYEGTALISTDESINLQKTAGETINIFADHANTDLLLYVKYDGFEKSSSLMAKDIAAGVLLTALTGAYHHNPSEGGVIMAALLDGTTGEILWTNGTNSSSALHKTSDPVPTSTSSVFTAISPYQVLFAELPDKSKPQPKND